MKTETHTPGPWIADVQLYVRTADGQIIARCAATLGKYELEKINARLIAATPDLLRALKEAVEIIESEWPGEFKAGRAAITKATGEPK